MGIYSTVTISRSDAIERIQQALESATNEELANALFALTCDHTASNYTVRYDPELE